MRTWDTVRVVGVMVGVWMRIGDAGLPRRLAYGGLRIAPSDEVPVLELGSPGLLCCQLELDEHHVIAHAQR